jgi:ATP-dependent Clp protease ATP-binding subunit ClpA
VRQNVPFEGFDFDRLADRAGLALFQARAAVTEHGGTAITDAHLLLGLMKGAPELGPLLRPQIKFQQLSECLVGAVAGPTLAPTGTEVPFDPSAQALLRESARVADRFGQKEIVPAHILLAFLQAPSTVAGRCLQSAGLDFAATTEAVSSLVRGR